MAITQHKLLLDKKLTILAKSYSTAQLRIVTLNTMNSVVESPNKNWKEHWRHSSH